MDYLSLYDIAKIKGMSYAGIFAAAKRKSIQSIRINGVLHTTEAWFDEYQRYLGDRELRSRFNGKKAFDPKREEYCVRRVAERLGVRKQHIYWLIYTGQLKTYRKGSYHVITEDSLQAHLNRTEIIIKEYVA